MKIPPQGSPEFSQMLTTLRQRAEKKLAEDREMQRNLLKGATYGHLLAMTCCFMESFVKEHKDNPTVQDFVERANEIAGRIRHEAKAR